MFDKNNTESVLYHSNHFAGLNLKYSFSKMKYDHHSETRDAIKNSQAKKAKYSKPKGLQAKAYVFYSLICTFVIFLLIDFKKCKVAW